MPHILQNPTILQHSDSKISANPKFTSSRNSHFPNLHFSKIHFFPKFIFFQNSHFSKIHVFQEFKMSKKLNSSSQFTIQRIHSSQSTKFLQKSNRLHKTKKKVILRSPSGTAGMGLKKVLESCPRFLQTWKTESTEK